MEDLLSRLLLATLHSLGVLVGPSRQQPSSVAIATSHERWLQESLNLLAIQGYLNQGGELDQKWWSSINIPHVWQEWDQAKQQWLQDDNQRAPVILVETCLRALPNILTGQQQATDVIFPDSSMELVENVYRGNAIADFYNQTLQSSVVAYIRARLAHNDTTQIRILEIGAGTGGTTAGLLRQLEPFAAHIAEYCYTDLSKAFLNHAQRQYVPDYPYIVTRIFDVEKPLAQQGMASNYYDLAIAANVLHATKNIRNTLRNAKATLRKHGLLCLNEMSMKSLFTHLTFGLLEGWWLYEDEALRIPGSPVLSSENWTHVLTEEGFDSITFPALRADPSAHNLGQQIILAQSNGIVRQPLEYPSAPPTSLNRVRISAAKRSDTISSKQKSIVPEALDNQSIQFSSQQHLTQSHPTSHPNVNQEDLRQAATAYIKKLVASTLQVPINEIDAAQNLDAYGLDSILVVQLTNTLRQTFQKISNTLFFEVQTIYGVVDYLLENQAEAFMSLLDFDMPTTNVETTIKTTENRGKSRVIESANLDKGDRQNRFAFKPDSRKIRSVNLLSQISESKPRISVDSPENILKSNRDIAIIGLSGRYPQAENINEFWQNLKAGRNCITEIPQDRWDWKKYFDPTKGQEGTSYTKWGGFIDDVDKFDPFFFQLSPKDAEGMDPQERLFLQCAYSCIEDAGYTPATLCASRKVGVFVGVMNSTYPLQPSDWSMANRVSYLFNFQGPSLAVDTACSSALTALHLAVESLHSGTSECAIAGGVNLILDPVQFLSLSAMTMLSNSDQCKAFGDAADGFVDGEGVGAVILKPLAKAEADGDAIYGIIKGSLINAGGKTNGYTVPNPIAQAQLIQDTLKQAKIDPRTISYLEAHGTGTPLGDPIEITGLSRAFGPSEDKQFCAIGSVKSNIGHTESAAGIAGLTKVLLQMQHRQLVPSLHAKKLNPRIDFAETPFVVQQTLESWNRPVLTLDGVAKEYPRIAGISSFGAGGANAHIIIQEHPNNEVESLACYAQVHAIKQPSLIVISAKNEHQLKQIAYNLCLYAKGTNLTGQDSLEQVVIETAKLQAMAYTLQVGREAMEERLGLAVTSFADLIAKLEVFLNGQSLDEDFYRGQLKRHKESVSFLVNNDEFAETIDAWIHKRKYDKLLELWVKGFPVDWEQLYTAGTPPRIHLPTYPFSRERYWAKAFDRADLSPSLSAHHHSKIHPLVHQNTSDLASQRFTSSFTGQEFFLRDHRVNGKKMFPGVAYLEMARVAVEQALPNDLVHLKQGHIQLKNIVWVAPFIANSSGQSLHIKIFSNILEYAHKNNHSTSSISENFSEISYEIYSTTTDGEVTIHSQGIAVLSQSYEISPLNLSVLQERINHLYLNTQDCYNTFKSMGIDYDEGHRSIEYIYVNDYANYDSGNHSSNGIQVLAKLKLPTLTADAANAYVLHPSIMDAAFQACIGLTAQRSTLELGQISVPFALDSLHVIRRCVPVMWAWIRYSDTDSQANNTINRYVTKIDIDLCDERGNISVKIQGFSTRSLEIKNPEVQGLNNNHTWINYPVLQQKRVPSIPKFVNNSYGQRIIILLGYESISTYSIESEIEGVTCLNLPIRAEKLAVRFQDISAQVFDYIKMLLSKFSQGKTLIQIVIPFSGEIQLFTALTGLLKTVQLENPAFLGQVIALEPFSNIKELVSKIQENSHFPEDTLIRYYQGKRQIVSWQKLSSPKQSTPIPWQEGGVYLITGGLGRLGFIFAKHMAQQTQHVSLILTGRSPLNNEIQKQIQSLQLLGAKVIYQQVDVSQEQAIEDLIQFIKSDIGSLRGILHCAGFIKDNFILKKTRSEFQSVLAPKVDGAIYLDQATKDLNLDFFILFSSLAGHSGNVGQVDYACANAFMDAYAHYRNQLVTAGQRSGQTLSINWPLWQEGGMKIDDWSEQFMQQSSGLVALETPQGIQALLQGLASGQSQIMVLSGDPNRLQVSQPLNVSQYSSFQPSLEDTTYDNFEETGVKSNSYNIDSFDQVNENELGKRTLQYFKQLISSVLKIPLHRIQNDEPLEFYGINSFSIIQLNNQLEKTFGSLPKTLFFEYPTIDEISQYFITSHRYKLKVVLGTGQDQATIPTANSPQLIVNDNTSSPSISRSRFLQPLVSPSTIAVNPDESISSSADNTNRTQDIAIIGLTGRYPLSPDLETFWDNLSQGKNCITEIPEDRWNHSFYFDTDTTNPSETYSKWGGFLSDVDKFDPLFFNISPREAQLMNPNERLFLESVWDLLERSGYPPNKIQEQHNNNVGVYVGAMYQQYQALASEPAQASILSLSSYSAIANRVSYFFDFHGPSMAIDTMCSSSLIAIQMACESLFRRDCQMAIAGGVNLSIHPNKYIGLNLSQMIGHQSSSKSFGEGDGYLPAEGVGAVLLKPLTKAIEDQDSILAVIKSIRSNHGGHTHGFHVPNPNAQAQLIEDNFRKSGINPRTISYVEAAANGSPLGDPIEVAALNKAFQKFTQDQGFCAIGSVKSNIGHAEAASGMSQLTKVILQLQHQQIVPSINAETLNPNLSFDSSPFYLQKHLQPWQRPIINIDGQDQELPRRATISSFGAGGSNAHLIIEEYHSPSKSSQAPVFPEGDFLAERQIMVFSAKSSDRLQAVLQQMLQFVQSHQQLSLTQMAYTLQVGRMAMSHRIAIIVHNYDELVQGLREALIWLEDNTVMDTSIPVYIGNIENNKLGVKHLLSGKSGEAMLNVLLMEEDLDKIALYWVKGGTIPWRLLHKNEQYPILFLPTYPFAKRRCWVTEDNTVLSLKQLPIELDTFDSSSDTGILLTKPLSNRNIINEPTRDIVENPSNNIETLLVDVICQTLDLSTDELNLNTPLVQYGIDSIVFVQIYQKIIAKIITHVDMNHLRGCQTTREILHYLKSLQDGLQPGLLQVEERSLTSPPGLKSLTLDNVQFPELIQLNSKTEGRPVFWFHGLGGVTIYEPVAAKSQRPFYGIQPWSWINNTAITSHIQPMVKRYLDAIRSIQPNGPYDFGGYSLGGMLAYEATRQLQNQGDQVDTIVMVDTLPHNPNQMNKYSRKTDYLITLNRALTLSAWQEPEEVVRQKLISSDELDVSLNNDEYLTQLIVLAQARGLTKTEVEIRSSIEKSTNLDDFYQVDPFTFMSLPDPNTINCYYFRNKNGLMVGDQAPYYFATPEDKEKFAITDQSAVEQWANFLPNLQIIDIDSSSHMTMLSEEKSGQEIVKFCEKLYSEQYPLENN